ncbi:MAG: hypothetical protein R3297_07880 [Desulfobulbales bacterium]|nr:hypothetical protein [Desulfobulbales bacterium]
MHAVEVNRQERPETYRKNSYGSIVKFALFEAAILLVSLALVEFIFIKLDNAALPVSVENGNVISFEAVHSVRPLDLLWPMLIITVTVSLFATLVYKRYFTQQTGRRPE